MNYTTNFNTKTKYVQWLVHIFIHFIGEICAMASAFFFFFLIFFWILSYIIFVNQNKSTQTKLY